MNHWTENDFTHWIYGLREADRHIDDCAQCRGEMERLTLERGRVLETPEISQELLAAQRRKIYERVAEPVPNWIPLRWALPAAMVLVVVLTLSPRPPKKPVPISDEQLFSELSSMEQSAEPKAIAPIHKLFEEQP